MIRVLVVDDSALMRRIISRMLGKDQFIQVICTAQNGEEAIEKIEALKPDVVTMDVEMRAHERAGSPQTYHVTDPFTLHNAEFDALNMGACDFVPKDLSGGALNISRIEEELIRKVKAVAKRRTSSFPLRQGGVKQPPVPIAAGRPLRAIVAMGASTGGRPAFQHILTGLPKDFPVPIAIAQHMPKAFTQSFAERLNAVTRIVV